MKRKINLRLVGIAVLAIIITVVGITIVYYSLFKKQVRSDLETSAKLLCETHYFETMNTGMDNIEMSTDIKELRVTWVAADGKVLYDNDANSEKLSNHLNRPEISEAFEKGEAESVRKSDTMEKNTFYYAVRLDNNTVLRVATNAESIWSVFISAAPMTALIIMCIIIVCVALSHFLTRKIIEPIEKMAEHLNDTEYEAPYKELSPFSHMIRTQHTEILSAAKARQDFTANVSHELKTPLTAISGYAELLEGGVAEEENRQHFYEEIKKNSERLLALINDIIGLSELERSERELAFEEMDLYVCVSECMEELKFNAEQKDILLTFEGEHCNIHGNRDMIKELTENLVQNAIRYNNPGGRVNVSVVNSEHPVLIVKDNGIGIAASEQGRIFERF